VNLFTSQLLEGVPLAPNFSVRALAESSEGKSGSDLKEICRNASMLPTRELLRQAGGDINDLARIQARVRAHLLPVDLLTTRSMQGFNRRPLTIKDFLDPDGTFQAPDAVRPARVLWFPNPYFSNLNLSFLIAKLLICSCVFYVLYLLYTSFINLLLYLQGLLFFWS
jgi:hypothetical protein